MTEADGVALAIAVAIVGLLFFGRIAGLVEEAKNRPPDPARLAQHKARMDELLAKRDEIVRRDERRKVEAERLTLKESAPLQPIRQDSTSVGQPALRLKE